MAFLFRALPEIATERLLLRRLVFSDAKDFLHYAQNPAVAEHVLWSPMRSIWDAYETIWFQRSAYRHGLPCSWGIILRETGHMIGTIGYVEYAEEHKRAEIGYSLAQKHWGKGLMTEAVKAVVSFSWQETDLQRLQAFVETTNPASSHVLEKCGFTREGLLQSYVCNKGKRSSVYVYGLTRDTCGSITCQ